MNKNWPQGKFQGLIGFLNGSKFILDGHLLPGKHFFSLGWRTLANQECWEKVRNNGE